MGRQIGLTFSACLTERKLGTYNPILPRGSKYPLFKVSGTKPIEGMVFGTRNLKRVTVDQEAPPSRASG